SRADARAGAETEAGIGLSPKCKRAAPGSPRTPPSDPDPLGDLSLQGGRGTSASLVTQLGSDPSPVPLQAIHRQVALLTSDLESLLPASPPGRPVRRAARAS